MHTTTLRRYRKFVFIVMFRTIADFHTPVLSLSDFLHDADDIYRKRPLLIKSSAQAAASIIILNACTAKHHCRAMVLYVSAVHPLVCEIIEISLNEYDRCSLVSGTARQITERADQVCQIGRASCRERV